MGERGPAGADAAASGLNKSWTADPLIGTVCAEGGTGDATGGIGDATDTGGVTSIGS